jgi:thiosulfate/3-mercaptopyruvate sulfurtransferase
MEYAYDNVLASTQWINDHINNPKVRIIEVDYNPSASYVLGHIPGAVLVDWRKGLVDLTKRDIISKESFENLLQSMGVDDDTTLIVYGDFKNWFAAFAFWLCKYYGVKDVRLMNGSRKKWYEEDRPISSDSPSYARGTFKASDPVKSIRTSMSYVREILDSDNNKILVDVRSEDEYMGKVSAPPGYTTEYGQLDGHIPGAVNLPWDRALNEDGTFKSMTELKELYESIGITPNKEIITYCRIGERSAHTWFVLKYLLGYPYVKSYDGSWMEWSNTIGNPIEK